MPAPRNDTPQDVDDPRAYLKAVARRCKALAFLLNLLDFDDDVPHLCFHHYALRDSPDQCCMSIVRAMLEEYEKEGGDSSDSILSQASAVTGQADREEALGRRWRPEPPAGE